MALAQYQYPVDLTRFTGALEDQNWFNVRIEPGDRLQTMEFEARFREHARFHLKAWGEVVFWKLYTLGIARNKTTQRVLDSGVSPDELWSACTDYIENGRKESFEALRRKLFRSGVAVAAGAAGGASPALSTLILLSGPPRPTPRRAACHAVTNVRAPWRDQRSPRSIRTTRPPSQPPAGQ